MTVESLLERNRAWSRKMKETDPEFFEKLAELQAPEYLWIGCSDSRVPSNQIVGLLPGAIFVHRNVANVVAHADINCLSVLQYSVEVLNVRHIIVCGHYGCGGIDAAMSNREYGLIDNWLRNIKDVYIAHQAELEAIADPTARADRLCELNVIAQVTNTATTPIVQKAWRAGKTLSIHGLVYSLRDGVLQDLGVSVSSPQELPGVYRLAQD